MKQLLYQNHLNIPTKLVYATTRVPRIKIYYTKKKILYLHMLSFCALFISRLVYKKYQHQ